MGLKGLFCAHSGGPLWLGQRKFLNAFASIYIVWRKHSSRLGDSCILCSNCLSIHYLHAAFRVRCEKWGSACFRALLYDSLAPLCRGHPYLLTRRWKPGSMAQVGFHLCWQCPSPSPSRSSSHQSVQFPGMVSKRNSADRLMLLARGYREAEAWNLALNTPGHCRGGC